MIPNNEIDALTEALNARNESSTVSGDPSDPFILFLGSECARAAKVPKIESIAERAFDLFGGSSEQAAKYLPNVNRSDKTEVLKTLYKLLDGMPGELVYSMVQSLYKDLPVPLFYQDLAQLVKAGYFCRILTTSFDTLLEQALDGAGMQAGFDYVVSSLGIQSGESPDAPSVQATDNISIAQSRDDEREPTHIIKLHGDLAQQQINLSPSRIEKALLSERRFIKSELKGDIVMVGYEFENDPINQWLASTSSRREQLWWVSADPPQNEINHWANQVSVINGEGGRPENFFGQLVLRLVRRPVLESLGKSFKDYAAGSGLAFEDDADEETPESFEETYGEQDPAVVELRDRIRRSQAVLFSHEQTVDSALRPLSVQNQIDYQKRLIGGFEDKLREHPECKKRVIEMVNLIASFAERDHDDLQPRTADYLKYQVTAVLGEYQMEQPNQQIISAALCAIVLLGDRIRVEMGEVQPGESIREKMDEAAIILEYLRELATYVPSIAARGVI